jgi:teichoic acid transport system permease protein
VDNWQWRQKVAHLAWFEIVKQSRGAILSWGWFFIRPAIYVFCFWFALDVGLRASGMPLPDGVPYVLWLSAGIIPWFYMQEMLGAGSDVFHKFSYLVKKIKFPLAAIPTIRAEASLIVQLMLQVALLAMYFLCGMQLDLYLLQVPIALLLMFVFWDVFSLFISHLTAFSKDVANLVKALTTPLFWLSGVIFNVKGIPIDAVQVFLQYNPVTFFVTVFRDALVDKVWFWEDPGLCIGFAVVFAVTLFFAVMTYKNLGEEVSDVV